MRLIDADTLLELPELVDCEKIDTARVRKDIVNAPTVDAVSGVRCGECKFSEQFFGPDDIYCPIMDCYPSNDFYCGAGDRKGGKK